jgi:hypothetical protein
MTDVTRPKNVSSVMKGKMFLKMLSFLPALFLLYESVISYFLQSGFQSHWKYLYLAIIYSSHNLLQKYYVHQYLYTAETFITAMFSYASFDMKADYPFHAFSGRGVSHPNKLFCSVSVHTFSVTFICEAFCRGPRCTSLSRLFLLEIGPNFKIFSHN